MTVKELSSFLQIYGFFYVGTGPWVWIWIFQYRKQIAIMKFSSVVLHNCSAGGGKSEVSCFSFTKCMNNKSLAGDSSWASTDWTPLFWILSALETPVLSGFLFWLMVFFSKKTGNRMQPIYFIRVYFIYKRFLKILIWEQYWRMFSKKAELYWS